MGSSPLTRGKRHLEVGLQHLPGLIPAHAGKTSAMASLASLFGAHPRSRGENIVDKPNVLAALGSSPLTRGKRLPSVDLTEPIRLIPAHAGKTIALNVGKGRRKAHPRSRGENDRPPRGVRQAPGSSPLTRGKPERPGVERDNGRLIPAHAGKTARPRPPTSQARAHPRSRGENSTSPSSLRTESGSSPLTRGKLTLRSWNSPSRWLIPAHAGKTNQGSHHHADTRAHPRSRGENSVSGPPACEARGSSPLTRGKPTEEDPHPYVLGLIPAHAGKTVRVVLCPRCWWAHPRSRGENYSVRADADYTGGSSPLTRGKHFLTCAFIAQIDQILESLELCAFSESYSSQDVYATDAPRDRVRSIGLAPRSSRGAS